MADTECFPEQTAALFDFYKLKNTLQWKILQPPHITMFAASRPNPYEWNFHAIPHKMCTMQQAANCTPNFTEKSNLKIISKQMVDRMVYILFRMQERFLLECSSNDQSLWWIPLTFTSGNNPNFTNTNTRVWLSPRIPSTTIRVERHIGSWIIFNLQYIGKYIT